jgi:hypothetical protein
MTLRCGRCGREPEGDLLDAVRKGWTVHGVAAVVDDVVEAFQPDEIICRHCRTPLDGAKTNPNDESIALVRRAFEAR